MGSRGAIYSYNYVIDGVESAISPRAVPPGKQVTLKLEVYNGSSPAGLVVGKITQNDEVCRYGYKKNLPTGTSDKFDIDCSFIMGSNDIQVDYYAYHEYDGSPDAHRVIKFTAAAAQTCTQSVLVRKKDTSNVYLKGVTVEARPTTTGAVARGVTGSDGRCRLTLLKSKAYNISISPSSGYTCEYDPDCEKRGVTACGSEITFYFSPRGAGTCDQDVTVALSDGGAQGVALDWGDGTADYGNPPKTFRHSYTVGTAATIKATASGYEPASEYLIACRATISLVLHKSGTPPVTPPYTPPVTPPVQEPEPPAGGKWKRDAFMLVWDGNDVIINYEMKNADPTQVSNSPDQCRFSYYPVAKWGTKSAEGGRLNKYCADKEYTGSVRTFWTITPGMNIPVDLVMYDEQLKTRSVLDTFIVTVPEKEVAPPEQVKVTATSPIPLYFCAGGDAPKRIPHTVSAGILGEGSQLATGTEEEDVLEYYHVDFTEERIYETVRGGYDIKATWNLGRGTVHFDVKRAAPPEQVKVTATSPIPLYYTDDTDVYNVPIAKKSQFDLGIAICDGRYKRNECWERHPEKCVIYCSQITSYEGVKEETINTNGYRGRVRIDFTKRPYEMHVTITTVPVVMPGNKITVTVGHSFDITEINTIKCGEVVPLPVLIPPGQTAWIPKPIGYEICKKYIPSNRIVEFTAADGLAEGHHYVFTIYPITWIDQVLNDQVFEFKGAKTGTMENVTFIHKPICNLLGIPPESEECKDEVGEFLDPIYAYNTLNKILYHRDMHGNPAEPEMLDYVILPMVFAGSLVPMPVGKGTKLLARLSGDLAKHANTVSKKLWLKMHQKAIHQLAAVGDNVNLRTFADNFRIGNLPVCESILKQAAEVAGRSEPSRKLMRTNLGKWVKGLRAKWKTTPSLKTKLDDLEKGADGNVFKSFERTISDHFDDAAKAGDWKKAHEIYHSAAMSMDDMAYLEHNLAKFSPEFRRMHNIMRYGNDDFIKFLKTDKAAVPEFANRFDEGVEYIIRHIGEETGQEVGAYKVILDALPESEVATIVRNLRGAGKGAAAAVTHVLKADATKGVGAFYSAAAKGVGKGEKLSRKERKALAASLKTKLDDAAKTMTPKETAAVETLLETDDVVKHPKLARLWKGIHGTEGRERFRDFPFWKKAAVIGAAFFVLDAVWKKMMDFCMALFMGEETIQWAGFGGIVLNSLTYNWDEKPLAERKRLITVFTDFKEKRQKIHDVVTTGSTIFEALCLPFAHIYRNFWAADDISIAALGTKIEAMGAGIDPLSGLGECTLIAQADKQGVAFYVHGVTKKYYSGAAFSKVYIPEVLVREDPYEVVLCAEKDGYCLLMSKIRITENELGNKISTPLFNMVPNTEAGPNPFSGLPYTDEEYNKLAERPEKPVATKFGKIICSTSPPGAKIYLDGVYKNALTNWTLEYVPLGNHTVVFKKDGYEDCTVNVVVAVEPDTQAYCTFEGVEGAITFKCAHNDDYCTRGATIFYRKEGASAWETFGKKTSSYAVTKSGLEAGVYEVRYNLLNAMECQGEVTVIAGETVDFNKQLRSRLPKTVRTTVTAIVDGDGIRTAYTDNLSEFPPPATKYEHQEIRIIGYNAEECEDFPTVCAPGGKEAGERLKELIPVGTDIELRIYEWYPLGVNNRIIAGVFKDGEDIVKEMLRSCLVHITEAKYQSAYPWIKWKGENSYDEAWCDPAETNVTISTSDAYGASMNVDVIMFDNEMKGSAEGGVTIKKVRAGIHTVEIRDEILEDQKLWAYVQPLNKAFKVPCIFEIDVQPGETYRVRVRMGVKAGEPVEGARQVTFSTAPSSAQIHVDERVYMQRAGEITKIPMVIGKSQAIEFQAADYAPLNVELMVTADTIKCLTSDVCGYKTSRPYVLVTKDYVRVFLKLLATTSVTVGSFEEWKVKKGGEEGIGSDEVLSISQAYKGKKEIGFMPSLDDIIDTVGDYLDRKP